MNRFLGSQPVRDLLEIMATVAVLFLLVALCGCSVLPVGAPKASSGPTVPAQSNTFVWQAPQVIPAGSQCDIEGSADLVHWQVVMTNAPVMFFRMKWRVQ